MQGLVGRIAGALALASAMAVAGTGGAAAEIRELTLGGFSVSHRFTVPGDTATIYDAMTGEIGGWWDHTFSGKPKSFRIEPKPGGGFYEIFDDTGDGVLHGTVIYAQRGKLLRFRGPLGLSGNAIDMVVSWMYEAKGDSTVVTCVANVAGEFDKDWPKAVDGVWRHFMIEQFKPYVEAGRHRKQPPRTGKR